MAKNKPKRTKDQLIIDPLIKHLCDIIQNRTKENKELKAKIAELEKKLKIETLVK